jgi:hypothetical protein
VSGPIWKVLENKRFRTRTCSRAEVERLVRCKPFGEKNEYV